MGTSGCRLGGLIKGLLASLTPKEMTWPLFCCRLFELACV